MTIYVFGNEDLPQDSIPLEILPELRKTFPKIHFETKDPNEEWDVPENLTVIDTAVGINEITIFDNLENFSPVPRVSMHDFDALTNLRYLKKIGVLKKILVIAIPGGIKKNEAVKLLAPFIKKCASGV